MRYYCIPTLIGQAAAANAFLTGEKVNVTTFVVGDGGGQEYEPTPDMTELRNEVWRGVVTNAEIDPYSPNVINYSTVIPSNVGGFTMREYGVVDNKGKLIGIGNLASTPKIRFEDGISDETELTFALTITNPEAMDWQVDPTVIIATKRNLQDHNLDPEAHPFLRSQVPTELVAAIIHEFNYDPMVALYENAEGFSRLPYGAGAFGGGPAVSVPVKVEHLSGRRINIYTIPKYTGSPRVVRHSQRQVALVYPDDRNLIIMMG